MHEIEYMGKIIPYTIVRSNIKNMYIQVKGGEVIVKAPNKLKEKYILEFVNKKTKWIYIKVNESNVKIKTEEVNQEDIERLSTIVKENVKKYSEKLGVQPKKVRIIKLKYAWGSCSSNQNITISMQLAKKEEKVIEYVVLHEMCHLVYMNHSKQFWNLLEKYMPEYKIYKNKLNKQ